ncbi:MAG: DMT family transporter [Desulfarculaceae bacterium]
MPHLFWGNLSALLAAGLFGASIAATRVVIQDVPPLSLAVFRFGQGGLILFLCLFIAARGLLKVKRRDLPFLILLGAVMFVALPVTFHIGIGFTEASRGALMMATMPIWSAFLARAARKERLTPRQVSGILITFAGMGVVLSERGLNWQANAWALVGDGFMLLAALCAAIFGVLAQRMLSRYSALTVTTYAMLFGTLLLIPAALVEGLPQAFIQIDEKVAALLLFLGIMGGALGFFLWTFALTRLSPTQVAVYANVNPMVAAILGVILLGEEFTGLFAVGFVSIVAGVLLVNWPRKNTSLKGIR